MSGTRGRKAVTFTGSSEAIKFLDNLIRAYVGQDNYFADYFLRLGNYDDFKRLCNEAWLSVLQDLSKNKQKQYSTDTTSKAFFTNFITQLSFFQQRLGVYLKQKVLNQLQDMRNNYIPPKINTLHSLYRVDTFDKTKQTFSFENSNLIRIGSMDKITDLKDLNKEAIVILNLKEDTKKAIIHHTENHLLNALTQLSEMKYDKKDQSRPIIAFQTIFTGYKSWIEKSNDNVRKSLSKIYKDMMKTLEDIFRLFEDENEDIEEEELLVKKLLINDIERLKEINNSLTESSYEGMSFPAFPGIIRSSDITALSPSFQSGGSINEIQTNRYLLPICGSGWNKAKNSFNLLIELIWLAKSIRELDEDQFSKSIFLTDLEDQINRYFKQLEIKIEQLKLEDYELLQNLIVKEGSLQELHEFVITSMSKDISYSFVDYQQKRGSTEDITFKSDIKMMDEETQHVMLINNNWGKLEEKIDYGWDYMELDTLPEIITYLLSNSGIWPKNIEIHLMDANLYTRDKRWNNTQNKDLFRWLKATIDSITLYSIMNSEIKLFPGNSFFDLTVKDKLLLIPILNDRLGRTQTHTYYYDLVDGLIAQDTIKDDLEDRITSNSVFLNQQKSTSEDEMFNLLDNYFRLKLQTKVMDPITNRINLQHFNRLSLYKKETITEKFNKNLPVLKNPNLVKPVLGFLETYGYTAEIAVAYLTDPKNEGRKNVPNEMSYIKFQTKENDRTIILPLLFFIFLIENLGGKSGEALSSIYEKLDNNNYHKIITEFMKQEYIQKSLKTLSGQLFETSGGIGNIMKTNLSVWRTDSSVILDDSKLDNSFYVVYIEAHTIQSYDDLNRDSMVRIYIVKYTVKNAPMIIFNEYFLCDKNKNHLDYRRFVEEIIFLLMFRLDDYVFISIKNISGIGEFLARTQNLSISQGVWNRFRNLSQKIIEELQNTNKTNKLFGYVNNFGMIPLTTYKTKTGQDLHLTIWEFPTAFLKEDLSGYQIDEYNFFSILISRPKSRSHHFKKEKKSDKEIPNFNIYSKLDAFVNLQTQNSKLTEKVIEEVKDLLKLGLLLGGEAAKVGTVGFSRLFCYPYSDIFRIVYSPSILLKGVDFFVLR